MSELNERLSQSGTKLHENNSWYGSRENQRQHILWLASQLLINSDLSPSEAVTTAEELTQIFYTRHIQKSTRID